jgi:7,8-dihydropterin-6-yl-methyl-4-(beta-D-ribofuranosyl)aminobenzene 5'-phosphate synthase
VVYPRFSAWSVPGFPLRDYGITKVACNHCTGRTAVEKMLQQGLPVVRGTAQHGSQTDLFLGNGDVLQLG